MHSVARPILAVERVRFVGDTVALVVAETEEQAQSAAEAIDIVYEPLAAIVTAEDALAAQRSARARAIPDQLVLLTGKWAAGTA